MKPIFFKSIKIIIPLLLMFTTGLSAKPYECNGDAVGSIHGATKDRTKSISEDSGKNKRYFYFKTKVNGSLDLSFSNTGGKKQKLAIGTTCDDDDLYSGGSKKSDSTTLNVVANTNYFIYMQEKNSDDKLKFQLDFAFTSSEANLKVREISPPTPEPVRVNQDVTFTNRVNNYGSRDSQANIYLDITYNQAVEVVSASQTAGGNDFTCLPANGSLPKGSKIRCTKTSQLNVGASNKDFKFVVKPTIYGTLKQTARINSSTSIDSVQSDNRLDSSINVKPTVNSTPSLCYSSVNYSGSACVNVGLFKGGVNCTQSISLLNSGTKELTDVKLGLDQGGFTGSFFSKCGIDGVNGTGTTCVDKNAFDFGPFNFFDRGIEFSPVSNFAANDEKVLFTKSLTSSAIFSGNNLIASYTLDGTRYSGQVQQCEALPADDLCYDKIKYKADGLGFCINFGLFKGGINCKTSIEIKNQGGGELTHASAVLTQSGVGGGFLDKCGINGSTGNCQEKEVMNFGPFDFIDRGVEFKPMPDFSPTDTHTIFGKSLISMAMFSGNNLYATYVKNGELRSGQLHSCKPSTPASLMAEYRFDACNLNTMVDSSGNGYNGTLQNIIAEDIYPKHEEKGMVCTAGRFYSFVSNYAEVGDSLQSNIDDFSITFSLDWAGNNGDMPIITKEGVYEVKINAGKLYYKLGGDASFTEVSNVTIKPNVPYHIAIVVESPTVKIYQNGSLRSIETTTYSKVENSNLTYIGTSDFSKFFAGLLDEMRFYRGVLSANEILDLAGRNLRPCACCDSNIKIIGDYVKVGDTYDASRPAWDSQDFNGFAFDEPPLLFILPSDNGGHSAYIRAKNVTEKGFEVANIEPQGEDGPHIAMDLSYIAVNRGVHDLGEYKLESCTIPVQTEQFHNQGNPQDFNATNNAGFGNAGSCSATGCWTRITTKNTYKNPVVFATLITAENEQRRDWDEASGRELSRPWMTVAIKNDASGIWVSLERSETSFGKITKPEQVAYMITEGNIQSEFKDDYDNNISYETIHYTDRFLGYDKRSSTTQQFDFNRSYSTAKFPLVMANKNSRKDADGGWFRLNGKPESNRLRVSIWEDRLGAYSAEGSYDNPNDPNSPIGISGNQDSERTRDIADDGAAIVFANAFQYAESYKPTAGAFDAVEENATFHTILNTKIVDKPFKLTYFSLDSGDTNNDGVIDESDVIEKPINSPVKVELIYSNNPTVNLGKTECNSTTVSVIPNATKYKHFFDTFTSINSVEYNLTNTTAYRNVQVRFTFGADENGTANDWKACYNNSADCDDVIYTPTCVATCTATPESARSEACAKCYFDNVADTEVGYSCSFDRFAIRPERFQIAVNGSTLNDQNITSGTPFQIDANATNYHGGYAVNDYNATQVSIQNKPLFNIAPSNIKKAAACVDGLLIKTDDTNFTNGDYQDVDGYYNNIGDINITVFETPNPSYAGIFASVDTGNVNGAFDTPDDQLLIGSGTTTVHFKVHHFDVNLTFNDFNNSNSTYYDNNASAMGSRLAYTIVAKNDQNQSTSNFQTACAAEDLRHSVSFNYTINANDPNLQMHYIDENDTNVVLAGPLFTAGNNANQVANFVELNTSFTGAIVGGADEVYDINFRRATNVALNPIRLELNGFDVQNRTGGFDFAETVDILDAPIPPNAEDNATFYYGRANAQNNNIINGNVGAVPIYFEIYCNGAGCNRTLLPNGVNAPRSIESTRWYQNANHNYLRDGNITFARQEFNKNIVTPQGITPTSPANLTVQYDASQGYPYKTTMEYGTSDWLIYNKFDNAATVNDFDVTFKGAAGQWTGTRKTTTHADDNAAPETNNRIMW